MRVIFVALLTLVLVALALGSGLGLGQGSSEPGQKAAASDTSRVDPGVRVTAVFNRSCAVAGCHWGKRPAAKLNLEAGKELDATKDVASRQVRSLKLVDTRNPDKSYLLMKLRGQKGIKGKQMPRYAPALKKEEIQAVEMWIQALSAEEQEKRKNEEAEVSPGGSSDTSRHESNPVFSAMTLVNLPTTETLEKGEILFRVSHRYYNRVAEGHGALYGLDGPAFILLSLAYGLSDDWSVAVGRTNLRDEVQVSSTVSLVSQGVRGWPLSASVLGGACLTTEVPEGEKTFASENFRGNLQLSISRKCGERFTCLAVPSYSHNTDYSRLQEEGTFGLGLGSRVVVLEDVAIVAEVIPVISGYSVGKNTWGLGIEITRGGHVFHVFAGNSYGLTPNQYVPGGDLDIADRDFRIGFNIYRSL